MPSQVCGGGRCRTGAAARATGLVYFRNQAGFKQSPRRCKGDFMGAFVLHDIVPPLIRREFRFHVVKNVLLSRFSQGTLQLFPMIRSDALHCSLMDDEEVLYSTN